MFLPNNASILHSPALRSPSPMNQSGDRRAPAAKIRHDELLAFVRQRGCVPIEAMAARFPLSTQTARRDIRFLHERGLLERRHGGAGPPAGQDVLACANRRVRNAQEKRAIGNLVARNVPNATSLFIDIGTLGDDGGLLDHAYRDLPVSRAAMKNSRRRFLVMARGRFDADAMMWPGHVPEVDDLFSNGRPPAPVCRALRANGVKLDVARG